MLTTMQFISILAIVFGFVWLSVGLYTYAPVYRKAFMRLIGRAKRPRVYDQETALDDADLPTIDVLLPAYDEAETIEHAIRSIRAADYPEDRLVVSVLVEPSDAVTRRTLAQLRGRYAFRELVIPTSYPGAPNKPRALNYGFERTTGDIVGVIDAEDMVAPELFRQVVTALVDDDHDYTQGRLDMQNEDDGLLNTLFRGEYGFWYGTVIPSYSRVNYPVPLGGTTNFVKRSVLEAVSTERIERFGSPWTRADCELLVESGCTGATPWDPRNVTEDFELGLFLWETGRSMAMVTAVTREESPVGLNAWIRQRTRWQKGKLYTLFQRLRSPPAGVRAKLHIYMQAATPHLGPINLLGVLLVAIYATLAGFMAAPVVALVLLGGLVLALQQMVIHGAGYWTVTDTRGATRVRRTAANVLGVPVYWALQWGADIRAFVQLGFGHTGWEKTKHTGRHINLGEATSTPEPSDAFHSVTRQTDEGWLWAIEREGTEVARASRAFPSETEAMQAAAAFGPLLSVARGTGSRFDVENEADGWTWALRTDDEVLAVAPDLAPGRPESLASAGRARLAAGVAAVKPRTDDDDRNPDRNDAPVGQASAGK